MGYARKSLVSLQDTPYYHVVARCVRRSWLWGFDQYAGKDYSHRKDWVIERLRELAQVFAIHTCAYAVLSNHYHLVLYVDVDQAAGWSDEELIERWKRLFRLPTLIERYQHQEPQSQAELDAVKGILARWRSRLHDISWYMRALNEHLARRANAEDGCSGRFWEGRFRSQALLDEAGILTAMAYVDLNPIRAGIAQTPETSDFTSIEQRIREAASPTEHAPEDRVPLLPFQSESANTTSIPYVWSDYLQLVDWTGRQIRDDKRGHIDERLPPILTRLKIEPDAWESAMQPRGNIFGRALGKLDHLKLHAELLKQSWIRNQSRCARTFG